MISVIIPTYNRCLFLGEAVHSVLNQTRPCSEVIVVDDGSTDDTRALVAALAGKTSIPVIYIYQENRGAAAARNTGIRAARYPLLSFLDSDDRFAPDKLLVQGQEMRNSPHAVSHTRETWYRRGVLLNQKKKHAPPDGYIFPDCLGMCVVGMSTIMICRNIFERYGLFDEDLPCCEDYDFWLRISAKEHFLLIDRPLTIKNGGRPDQLSVQHRIGMDRYRINALAKLLKNGGLDEEQYLLALAEMERKCEIYGQGCLKHGRVEEGQSVLALPGRYRGLSRGLGV